MKCYRRCYPYITVGYKISLMSGGQVEAGTVVPARNAIVMLCVPLCRSAVMLK
jgi:hypothetical protein